MQKKNITGLKHRNSIYMLQLAERNYSNETWLGQSKKEKRNSNLLEIIRLLLIIMSSFGMTTLMSYTS
jgi:hypothetical protein